MSSKFEVFKSPKNNQFYFHLKASNGQIILQSEAYTKKANCLHAIESVKKYAVDDKAYLKHDQHFNLKSLANGQIIGSSQNYANETTRNKGIESVKRNAPTATIIDLTKKA